MSWRDLITVRAGYTARTHNRWFSNWVAFRDRLSRDAIAFHIIRIAPKRIVFEIPGQSVNLYKSELQSRFSWMGKRVIVAVGLVVVVLSIVVVLSAQQSSVLLAPEHAYGHTAANASSSQSPKPKPCVEIENLRSGAIIENTEAFSADGWHLVSQSKLVSRPACIGRLLGNLRQCCTSHSCLVHLPRQRLADRKNGPDRIVRAISS